MPITVYPSAHVNIAVNDSMQILFEHNSFFDILNLITLGLKLICLHVQSLACYSICSYEPGHSANSTSHILPCHTAKTDFTVMETQTSNLII